jgi:hypothetical protein
MLAACGDAAVDEAGREATGATGTTPWFEEVAAASGLAFEHTTGRRPGRYLMPESIGGGAALLDADGDGRLDAYLVQSGSLDAPSGDASRNRLFLQRPDGNGALRFVDSTDGSGADDRGYGMGAAAGDLDGDGRTDLVVTNWGPNALLLARGEGRFEDATAEWSAGHEGWGTSAALGDLDVDGDLELYVANYVAWTIEGEIECRNRRGERDFCPPANYHAPEADALLENVDGRGFNDVSTASGVASVLRYGLGVACLDLDADGRLDLFVANDGVPDVLWLNLGGLRVEDVASRVGCAVDASGQEKAGMGVALGDVDDDGDDDLFVCNIEGETDSFFENRGGLFVDRTRGAGLGGTSRPFTRFGVAWVDLDADGRLDLFQANGRVNRSETTFGEDPYAEPNLVLRGLEGGRWEEVLPRGGTSSLLAGSSRGAAFGDLDDDGGVDVIVVDEDAPALLLRNVVPERGRWIGFRLVDARGADALNATVSCRVGDRIATRRTRAAYSFQASNDPRAHFGLGAVDGVQDVVVRWPDGVEERYGELPAGRYHTLVRGRGE